MELFEVLKKIVEVFESLGIPYLVTGSVAAMAYGEPRLTNDIDVVAAVGERHVKGLLEAFHLMNSTSVKNLKHCVAKERSNLRI
jgi:hypothetical protein